MIQLFGNRLKNRPTRLKIQINFIKPYLNYVFEVKKIGHAGIKNLNLHHQKFVTWEKQSLTATMNLNPISEKK